MADNNFYHAERLTKLEVTQKAFEQDFGEMKDNVKGIKDALVQHTVEERKVWGEITNHLAENSVSIASFKAWFIGVGVGGTTLITLIKFFNG